MDTFVWQPRYELGIAEVDAEHRRLVDMINEAGRLRECGAGVDAMEALVAQLGDYAVAHFATEERMMAAYGCDPRHVTEHDRAHRSFIEQVALMARMSRQDPTGMTGPMLTFLASWLAYHILGTDQAMGRQIAAIREGTPAARAYDEDNRYEDTATGVLLAVLSSLYDQLADYSQALAAANQELERRVTARTHELELANARLTAERQRQAELIAKLEEAQSHLLQSEKMAGIGQLAAGVAHEINNPVGFVNSNLGALRGYLKTLLGLVDGYLAEEPNMGCDPATRARLTNLREAADLEFLRQDVADLLDESQDGLGRVKRIVQDLKDFSRVDQAEWQDADLNQGLDSTLNVVWNELKYKAQVSKDYGALPPVRCIPAQLNQVFMNLLVNAAQAIEGAGRIVIRSGVSGERVWVEIEDNGKGMSEDVRRRMFEPFYTTKPVGKGTGLGLSVSYGIVNRHGGEFEVRSAPGRGTVIRVWLPITGERNAAEAVHEMPSSQLVAQGTLLQFDRVTENGA